MIKKLKWYILPCAAIMASILRTGQCEAASFHTLQEAKEAAWAAYCTKSDDSQGSLEENLHIDGAVDAYGGAKISIDNWKNKGIPKENKELPVFNAPNAKEVIGKLYPDTIMSVVSTEGDWVRLQSGYLQGYIRKDSIFEGNEARDRAEQACPRQILSDYEDTQIMSAPDTQSKVLQYMVQRKVYPVLEVKNGWVKISVSDNLKGYVALQNVKQVRSIHFGRTIENMENPQEPFVVDKLTAQECRMLAALIYCEAQGEVFEGQVAIGTVVLNRLHSSHYPDSLSEVILQKDQFEPVTLGKYAAVLKNPEIISPSCYEAAEAAIQGSNTVGAALYFKVGDYGEIIGNHGFY